MSLSTIAALCLCIPEVPIDILRIIRAIIVDTIRPKYITTYNYIIDALNNKKSVRVEQQMPSAILSFTTYNRQCIDHCVTTFYTINIFLDNPPSLRLRTKCGYSHEDFHIIKSKLDGLIKYIASQNYDLLIYIRHDQILLSAKQYNFAY